MAPDFNKEETSVKLKYFYAWAKFTVFINISIVIQNLCITLILKHIISCSFYSFIVFCLFTHVNVLQNHNYFTKDSLFFP